jgi:hypothetical protein
MSTQRILAMHLCNMCMVHPPFVVSLCSRFIQSQFFIKFEQTFGETYQHLQGKIYSFRIDMKYIFILYAFGMNVEPFVLYY